MKRAFIVAGGLVLLGLAAGCGGGDEAVVKDQIALMNEAAAAYEKVTDADSWKKAQAEVEGLLPRAAELRKKENAWPEAKKKQLGEQFAGALNEATQRLEAARQAARKKAQGGKDGPP